MIDYGSIERKWQEEWEKAKIFESDINSKKAYVVTAAYPYVNSPQHIGHMRTFGTADVLARYKRMQGFNVLYPMAFHATGTPILAFAKRIKNKDPDLIKELRIFHIPDAEIAKMTDPLYLANYFAKEIERGMHLAGFSIDWRRKFISIEPMYSKFIEWQFGQLNAAKRLTQGSHPVGWCPNENNAVGMHDTKHDVEPEIDKEISIKFKVDGEEAYLLCTTYRPETIFGVTNLFVKQDAKYVLCSIDGEKYYISKAAAENLKYQLKLDIVSEVDGATLLAKNAVNPVTGAKLPVLPGYFVKEDLGTAVVMSVPAHAPFDYAALERLRLSGYKMPQITPIKVIDVKVGNSLASKDAKPVLHPDIPSLAYLETLGHDINSLDDALEFATKLEYREESHSGKMIAKGYEGMSEPEARDKIKAELAKAKNGFEIYVLTNSPVYCRCGYKVVVKLVENQWFLNYGDKAWKEQTKQAFSEIKVLPEKSRKAFESALDWIDLRAVVRAQGLGTRFPLDKEKIIESLSDSTIYMALYTIAHLVRPVDVEKLKPEFFDYVFLGKGDADAVAKKTGVDYEIIKKSKESFEYWYTYTSRHSGPDLIFNHLIMYAYNHVSIFDKKYWPKQIVVNGSVLSEGEKMSKSLGNIVPLSDAMQAHGVDPLRFVIVAGADLFSDSEFSYDAVNGVKERIEYIYNATSNLESMQSEELKHIDYWMYSKLNRKIAKVTKSMDMLELRAASTELLYNSIIELKRYFARGGNNSMVVKEYLSDCTLMLSPIAPHISEEFWHMLGNSNFASTEKWPESDPSMISEKAEAEEELVDRIIADARQVVEILKKKNGKAPEQLKLIVAQQWKRILYNIVAEQKAPNKVIEWLKAGEIKDMEQYSKQVDTGAAIEYVLNISKKKDLKPSPLSQEEEAELLNEASQYISDMLGCKITIENEEGSKSEKAKRALPGKPSIEAA